MSQDSCGTVWGSAQMRFKAPVCVLTRCHGNLSDLQILILLLALAAFCFMIAGEQHRAGARVRSQVIARAGLHSV